MKTFLLTFAIILGVVVSGCNQAKESASEKCSTTECCTKECCTKECPTSGCCAEATAIDESKVVNLVYQVQVKPESKDDILKAFETLVSETRKEKGCIIYDLFQNGEDPNNFILIEKWATQEDLDNHSTSDHFKDYLNDSDGKFEKAELKKVNPVY